jgi:S-methylmethionine-dependent homocysteine/selenocysteine methylase
MINCAHPTHFSGILAAGEAWTDRIHGLRANASRKSHTELDAATALDAGDPGELAAEYSDLCGKLRKLNVVGGCCGTDHRHIARIGLACAAVERTSAAA